MSYRRVILNTPGLIGYWRLGESTGAGGLIDETGSFNGTYQGVNSFSNPGALQNDSNTCIS